MPTYEYRCPDCAHDFEKILKSADCKVPQDCPECGTVADKQVSRTSFILKGDGWPGKNLRIKTQMGNRRKKLAQKERDHVAPNLTLAPNVGGERTDSWKDAQGLARDKGLSAKSYDPVVQKEKQAR